MFYLSLEIMNTKRNKLPNAVSVLNRERERERIRKKHHANWRTHTHTHGMSYGAERICSFREWNLKITGYQGPVQNFQFLAPFIVGEARKFKCGSDFEIVSVISLQFSA